jgi:osmotically inducible protein OsmC
MQAAGYTPTELNTETTVSLEQDKDGFHIRRSALTLTASVPNLDQETFDLLTQDAEKTCPISRVLRAEITLDAKLV